MSTSGTPVLQEQGAFRLDPSRILDREVLGESWRLLRLPGWWRSLVGVILLSIAFVGLGQWQFGRHADKVATLTRINDNYDAPSVPLRQVLATPSSPLPPAAQWRRVSATGVYDAARTVVVRNRVLDGDGGYEILVPLRTTDGSVVMVDRGWVPAGRTPAGPDAVAPPPAGVVTVQMRLRPSEPAASRSAPAGQALRVNVPELTRAMALDGTDVFSAYGLMAAETPASAAADATPRALDRPEVDTGINLSYGFQWYLFAVTAYVLFGYFLVREAQQRLGIASRAARTPAYSED